MRNEAESISWTSEVGLVHRETDVTRVAPADSATSRVLPSGSENWAVQLSRAGCSFLQGELSKVSVFFRQFGTLFLIQTSPTKPMVLKTVQVHCPHPLKSSRPKPGLTNSEPTRKPTHASTDGQPMEHPPAKQKKQKESQTRQKGIKIPFPVAPRSTGIPSPVVAPRTEAGLYQYSNECVTLRAALQFSQFEVHFPIAFDFRNFFFQAVQAPCICLWGEFRASSASRSICLCIHQHA